MEAISKKEQKEEINEFLDFLNSLNTEEKSVFKGIIDGFKLGRQFGKESVKN